LKPPGALAQLRYAESFDSDFSLLLRERESASLADMQNDAIKVEVNMLAAKKSKMAKTKIKEEEKPSTSAQEEKFETMMKTMEKLMDRLALGTASAPPVQQEPQFRRPQNQQRLRDNRNQQGNPPVRPPFQQNLVDEEDEPEVPEESIHCFDEEVSGIFLTKEEHDESSMIKSREEPSDFLNGFQHAIFEMQKQYNLRNRDVPITANKA